ncbi:MAG: serine/threonine-protein kinase [Polyangiaceae bacterium]
MGEILAGKYRVERVLGMGGMGVVVAATHIQLDQLVALKFLLPAALLKPSAVGRFEREARAAVRLRSEHVARVIDVGKLDDGAPYIVMEYLEGLDLGDVVEKNGQLSVAEAVDYLLQACEAVAEAHSLGIIHRDLKPQNLFLTSRVDGKPLVKVLDFGISKVNQGADELSLTKTTDVVGSPNYMSPEQLRAARLADARSDIWALGAILYELLSGRVPFEAETLTQLCAMVISDPPRPLKDLRADIPLDLVAVIERCLDKDPTRRFQNVAELADALESFSDAPASTTSARIKGIAATSTGNVLRVSASSSGKVASIARAGASSAGWANTELAEPRKVRSTGLIVGMAIGGTAVVLIGGLVAYQAMHHAPPSPPVASAPSAEQPVASAAKPAAVDPPVVDFASLPSASASTGTGTSPIKPSTKPKPKPHPQNPTDDLPNDRH